MVFMEAFMYRLHPQWRTTRELVASGRLGQLQAIQTFFANNNPDPANIRNIARYGGGALMDIGCYAIDLSRMLFAAKPSTVSGAVRFDPDSGVDVLSSGLLTFPSGGQSSFTCGTRSQSGQWVHVVGSAGRLTVEVPFNAPRTSAPGSPSRPRTPGRRDRRRSQDGPSCLAARSGTA